MTILVDPGPPGVKMPNPAPKSFGQDLADAVTQSIGDEYVYGATGPKTFDCSGLIYYWAKQLGYPNVPRTSEDQFAKAAGRTTYSQGSFKASDVGKLSAGDLIFSQWPGDNAPPGHVAVYVGNGQVVEAPGTGQKVHKIPLDTGYFSHIIGTGRLGGTPTGGVGIGSPGTPANTGGSDPLGIGALVNDFADFAKLMGEFVNPGFWISTGILIVGVIFFAIGIRYLGKAASSHEVPA